MVIEMCWYGSQAIIIFEIGWYCSQTIIVLEIGWYGSLPYRSLLVSVGIVA